MQLSHHNGDSPVKSYRLPGTNMVVDRLSPLRCNAAAMTPPNRILELRTAKGLSQDQLADLAHTSGQQISRLEKGERRLSDHWMRLLAPALGVEPWELMAKPAARDPEADEILAIYASLDPERRNRLKADARDLLLAQQATAPDRATADDGLD